MFNFLRKPQKAESAPAVEEKKPQPIFVECENTPVIQIRNLKKVYKTGAGEFPALKNINACFEGGEFVGIIGKSGAGKSTLVNMLTGVDHLTSGEIWVGDVPLHQLNEDEMALWRGKNVGVVFQSFELMPSLTLLENITLAMDLSGEYKPGKSEERAMHLLKLVEIEEHANKLPALVSGGQKQRTAIARAMANDPMLIIADEPTGSLDSITANAIFKLFEELIHQGKTIILVTHDASLTGHFNHVLQIADGEIIDEIRNFS